MREVKIGIAGLGRLGMQHAENLAFYINGSKLTAVCSIVEEELERAKEKLGVNKCYNSYEEMLKDDGIDAVVIASTSAQHCEHIDMALDAGKHVFTEKPLGIDVEQCRIAEAAVKRHPEQIFMLGFMRRYDLSYVYAKQKIENGEIGKPYLYKGTGMDPLAVIAGALAYAGGSGGLYIDLGIHDIDLFRWFFGEDPIEVYALGASFAFPKFAEVGDAEAGCALYKFASGKMAMLHCARAAAHGYHIETEIVGTEGSVRISPVPRKNLAILYNTTGVVTECVETFQERFAESYRLELEEFVNCVNEGRKPSMTVQDGTKSTQIALATKEAFKTGKAVKIKY
jgi:myo-inositol 2-dehydrogenase/D-chiro-inositol 1-dehydrogenase